MNILPIIFLCQEHMHVHTLNFSFRFCNVFMHCYICHKHFISNCYYLLFVLLLISLWLASYDASKWCKIIFKFSDPYLQLMNPLTVSGWVFIFIVIFAIDIWEWWEVLFSVLVSFWLPHYPQVFGIMNIQMFSPLWCTTQYCLSVILLTPVTCAVMVSALDV